MRKDKKTASSDEVRAWIKELVALSKAQSHALQLSGYYGMGQEAKNDYDRRRLRIGELTDLLRSHRLLHDNPD